MGEICWIWEKIDVLIGCIIVQINYGNIDIKYKQILDLFHT